MALSSLQLGFLGIGCVFFLIALRVPVGIAMLGISYAGIAVQMGFSTANGILRIEPFDFSAHWTFTAIPMFLLMGAVVHHSGVSASLFRAARLWLGGLPGGLAVATNFACAGFSTACGSSVATAAAMGRIAIPEMLKAGYQPGLASGVVASAGTLGNMIPPSISFVIYGVFAEVSVAKLFMAGILPGILTAVVYAVMIVSRCMLNPAIAPSLKQVVEPRMRWQALGEIWPLLVLVVVIIGGLYGAIVTPTEAGAFGALASFLIAFAQRRLTLSVFRMSVIETLSTTAQIFLVGLGAVMFTRFLALTGVGAYMASEVVQLAFDPLVFIIGTTILYVLLGMFIDPLGLMLLTLPILLPMMEPLGIDLIWFGVLLVKFIEIGLLTPPVGLNIYVVKSIVGERIRLEEIFQGAFWFLACECLIVTLLVGFPGISLFLPSLM